jgi:hypothetical protein
LRKRVVKGGGKERGDLWVSLLRDVYKCQPLNHTEEQYDETILERNSMHQGLPRLNPVTIKNNGDEPAILFNLPRNAGVSIRHNNI